MAKPLQPEPKFFFIDGLFAKGLAYYENRFFPEKAASLLRGEKSVCYMESEKSAKRITQFFPKAKIIFVLRNPIERAVSHYNYTVANGLETLPLREAFLKDEKRKDDYDPKSISMSPYAYLSRGKYIDYVSIYSRLFGPESLKIVLYEELTGLTDTVQDIYRFLNVDPEFKAASSNKIVNESGESRYSLPMQMAEYLKDYYQQENEILARRFDLRLSKWWW